MKYTESQLNSMNKTNLVALALEQGTQIAAFESGPLKSTDVEKIMLDLARQAANVKSNDESKAQAHTIALAQIEADKELAIKKLELEYADTRGLEAKALEEAYDNIEEKAKLAIEDLSFGLKKAEVETQQRIDELNEKKAQIETQYNEAIEAKKKELAEITEKINSEKEALKVAHTRDMEQAKYDNKIALRDENLEAAEKIAAEHGKKVVDSLEYKELVDYAKTDEKEVQSKVDEAVEAAKAEVHASEGAKYSALKSSTDNTIALLGKDKEYLTKQNEELLKRIEELNNQIKDFPSQLKEAVAAAKADVTINQDNKK